MFEKSIERLCNWFTGTANFVKLENEAFDDRLGNNAFFITQADGQTYITQSTNNIVAIAKRRHYIYIQYIDFPGNFYESLFGFLNCSGELIESINYDSKRIFQEVNKVDLNDNNFSFLRITVELTDFIRSNNCNVC